MLRLEKIGTCRIVDHTYPSTVVADDPKAGIATASLVTRQAYAICAAVQGKPLVLRRKIETLQSLGRRRSCTIDQVSIPLRPRTDLAKRKKRPAGRQCIELNWEFGCGSRI